MKHFKKNGFTLVELSIVLVIIGLLIGGILVTQSMIQTVKLQSFVRYIGEIDVATSNFKTKYGCLPGDNNFLGHAGNCNGIVEDTYLKTGRTFGRYFDQEVSFFWADLSNSGFQPEKEVVYSSNAASGVKLGIHIPPAKIGTNLTGLMIFPQIVDGGINPHKNWYWLADYSISVNADYNRAGQFRPSLTPIEALSIEQKMDDGLPSDVGIVRPAGGTGSCHNAGVYLTSSIPACSLHIAIAPML